MAVRRASSGPNVFISHSHRDRHTAVDLQAVLESHGADTYLDQDQIQVADDLPERIREGIDGCDAFLLIWSTGAASSDWVGLEWDRAYEMRKKIIPYVLDGTRLPRALENLVYVGADDQQHGNAKLLTAVLGKDFPVDPGTPFPGRWQATVDIPGVVQGTYDLELRANGQVVGEGGMSNCGFAGRLANEMDMGGLMTMRLPVHGSWSHEPKSQMLVIEMSVSVLDQRNDETVRIHTTGREEGAITGRDLGGRIWTLRRVDDPARRVPDTAQLRHAVQRLYDDSGKTEVFWLLLASLLKGAQIKSGSDLGLPTEKIDRLKNADAGELQAAFDDLLGWLVREGWIRS